MNMDNVNTFKVFKQYRLHSYLVIILLVCIFSGCQLTSEKNTSPSIAQYYLWLKSLTVEALSDELTHLNNTDEREHTNQKIHVKLALLYAIPKAVYHNPYTAKTILNQIDKTHFLAHDLAFIELLSEQLNQQIIALNKNVLTTQTLKSSQEKNHKLKEQVNKLSRQINQLKSIERDIQPQELNQ